MESPFLVSDVLRWAHCEFHSLKLIEHLGTIFGQCDLIDQISNRLNLKVARHNHSIGFVFGIMEELKPKYHIQEYSAT
jgi:hypothetical protein